jgi:hypothetical protein
MPDPKPKKLTMKQEKFCREYVLCMNQSEAYRRAFDVKNWKPESVWVKASQICAIGTVKTRIAELKNDVEEMLNINKVNQVNELIRIRNRCLKPEPKMVWVKNDKGKPEQVQEEDEEGNLMWAFDSAGANSAQDKILKALGYYAADKTQTQLLDKDGNPADPIQNITVNIKDNTNES